jgi:hypothetical protein
VQLRLSTGLCERPHSKVTLLVRPAVSKLSRASKESQLCVTTGANNLHPAAPAFIVPRLCLVHAIKVCCVHEEGGTRHQAAIIRVLLCFVATVSCLSSSLGIWPLFAGLHAVMCFVKMINVNLQVQYKLSNLSPCFWVHSAVEFQRGTQHSQCETPLKF